MIAHDGPFYYRCGYKQEPPVHAGKIEVRLGQAIQVRDGSDATLFFTGTIGNQVLPAAEALDRHGLHCRVVSLHTVKPIDRAAIVPAARDSNDLVEHLGLDMVTVPTMIYAADEVAGVARPEGIFRDRWGALQHLTHEAIPVPMLPARIESDDDLARYAPPDPAQSPIIAKVRRLRARFPDKAVAVVGESGWAPAVYLRGGIENLFLDLATRPQFAKDLMGIGAAYYAELFPLAIAAGADVVFLGDDYSDNRGPMMSPQMFEELILPHDATVVAAIKQAGAYCIKHTDGDIRKIMDQLVGIGVDALGPLQDVPGMELGKILDRFPGRITVMGNLSVDLLGRGTAEELVAATERLLREVSAKGPHILSSGNTIASCVRPENYLAVVRTTQECGRYPIEVSQVK